MSRGNDGIPILRDDADRQLFLDLLTQKIVRSNWILHEYCLMTKTTIVPSRRSTSALPAGSTAFRHSVLEDVIGSVASTFDTTPEAIATSHGTPERRLVAWFAFEEGLVPLRRIAKRLGLTMA